MRVPSRHVRAVISVKPVPTLTTLRPTLPVGRSFGNNHDLLLSDVLKDEPPRNAGIGEQGVSLARFRRQERNFGM